MLIKPSQFLIITSLGLALIAGATAGSSETCTTVNRCGQMQVLAEQEKATLSDDRKSEITESIRNFSVTRGFQVNFDQLQPVFRMLSSGRVKVNWTHTANHRIAVPVAIVSVATATVHNVSISY